jgi:hypothetical protein
VVVLAALAAWEAMQARQTATANWGVVTVAVAAVVAAVVAGWGRQPMRSRAWLASAARAGGEWRRTPLFSAGVVVWVLLILAVIGWDLNSFAHQAHDLPTLSYEFGRVTRHEWGRGLVFAAWLAAGVGLATGSLVRERKAGRGR